MGRERDHCSPLQHHQLLTASQSSPGAFPRAKTNPDFAYTMEKHLASSSLCPLKQVAAVGMGIGQEKGRERLTSTH